MATQYFLANCLQQYFVDKDTQLPLSGGIVTFYKDTDRTPSGLKAVYKYTGTPGNPAYTALPNPITLTPQGTIADASGNDVLFYFYPYDENGNLEQYYIKVENLDGVLQFDRSGMPQVEESGGTSQITNGGNMIANGQFWLHTNLLKDDTHEAGEIREESTPIGYGDWTFERPHDSSAKDIVTFPRFGSWSATPESNPRYAFSLETQTPSPGDDFKDLAVKFKNVNFLASATNKITVGMSGISNTGSNIDVDLVVYKYFGTGGSDYTQIDVETFTLTPSYQKFSTSFVLGDNDGKTIGSGDDDYIQIRWRFKTDTVQDLTMTDFFLLEGDISNPIFPEESPKEIVQRSLASSFEKPAYDGSNLYDVPRLTKTGFDWSGFPVGLPFSWFGPESTIPPAFAYCNGSKLRRTLSDTTTNIPHQRLFDVIGINWGNGDDYSFSFNDSGTLKIINNEGGSVTDSADGSTPTNFTFTKKVTGTSTDFGLYVEPMSGEGKFLLNYKTFDSSTPFDASTTGSTGFTVNHAVPQNKYFPATELWTVTAASGMEGKYWTFQGSSSTKYYVWYRVNGSGTDPAVSGHTGIQVDLDTGDLADEVMLKTCAAIRGAQYTHIVISGGSSINAGSFFEFYSTGEECYVWFEKDQTGNDPNISGKVGIKVSISSTNTATEVADLVVTAINTEFYQLPDGRNRSFIGIDDSAGLDDKLAYRYSKNPNIYGDKVGTYQRDFIQQFEFVPNLGVDFLTNEPGSEGSSGSGFNRTLQQIDGFYWGLGRNTVMNFGGLWIIKL